MKKIIFTHYWVSAFGWENTVFLPEDFQTIEILGKNEKDGTVFICKNEKGTNHIIKGTNE